MNRYCHLTGVGLIPWSPLYRGHLARPPGSPDTARSESDADNKIITRVHELAEKKGWPMTQVALAWILQKNTIPIVGFSSVDRMDQAVGVKGKTLTEEEIKYLEMPYVPKTIVGHS